MLKQEVFLTQAIWKIKTNKGTNQHILAICYYCPQKERCNINKNIKIGYTPLVILISPMTYFRSL